MLALLPLLLLATACGRDGTLLGVGGGTPSSAGPGGGGGAGSPLDLPVRKVSLGPGGLEVRADSRDPACSADSRYVAFVSEADDLVPGDTNGFVDVFVYDSVADTLERVSVASDGTQADARSFRPSLSADGRFVAFYSEAITLDPRERSRGASYLHDRLTRETVCISVPPGGQAPPREDREPPLARSGEPDERLARSARGSASARLGNCYEQPVPEPPVISADGRFVAFNSSDPDLVPGDTNDTQDVFLLDREAGTLERVSMRPDGSESPCMSWVGSISADGGRVAFTSYGSMDGLIASVREVYVWDRQTRTTVHASRAHDGQGGNDISYVDHMSLSGDGNRVVFLSAASNLVPGDDNGQMDLFLRDLASGQLRRLDTRISHAMWLTYQLPSHAMSPDGRHLLFMSDWPAFVPDDTNEMADVFLQDLETGQTRRVSGSLSGQESNGASEGAAISADGRYVLFSSHASNLVDRDTNFREDVFAVRLDLLPPQTGTARLPAEDPAAPVVRGSVTHRGWQPNGHVYDVSISEDGDVVAFVSTADNLVPGDTNEEEDVFVHDRSAGTTVRLTVSASGEQSDGQSFDPVVSADGSRVAFQSYATNLVPDDRNGVADVFVRDLGTGELVRGSLADSGAEPDDESENPSLSRDGRFLAFKTGADNMGTGRTIRDDVFVRDLQTKRTTWCNVNASGQGSDWHGWAPRISPDGRYVVYHSTSTNLDPAATGSQDKVFLFDRSTRTTEWVSRTDAGALPAQGCTDADVSADARRIVFVSTDATLVAGDTNGTADIFVRDRDAGRTWRVSTAAAQADRDCLEPRISADGRFVIFVSDSTTLGNPNPRGFRNLYLHDLQTGATEPLIAGLDGQWPNKDMLGHSMAGAGRWIAMITLATNLFPGDTNGAWDAVLLRNPHLTQ